MNAKQRRYLARHPKPAYTYTVHIVKPKRTISADEICKKYNQQVALNKLLKVV